MNITLTLDDSCIKGMQDDNPGVNIGSVILKAVKDDPQWWYSAADAVTVSGEFGRYTENRSSE